MFTWTLVGGLAWADSFDLNDDLAVPLTGAEVAIEPDFDEVRDDLEAVVWSAEALSLWATPLSTSCLTQAAVTSISAARSQGPRCRRLYTFRI